MPGTVPGMTVLVTSATGNIGRKVVDHLVGLDVSDIRAFVGVPRSNNTAWLPGTKLRI